jgi:hypothetical protein
VLHSIREYCVIVAKLWGQQISGPVLALISICAVVAGPFYAESPSAASVLLKASAWFTGIASVVLLFVAQYKAWCAERESYDRELARNSRPEISGRVGEFDVWQSVGNSIRSEENFCGCSVTFRVSMSNGRPVQTNLRDLRIDGSGMLVRATFENIVIRSPGETTTQMEALVNKTSRPHFHPTLPQGIYLEFVASAEIIVKGHHWAGLKNTLNLTGLRVEAIDGFGCPHRLEVEPGATVSV